MAWLGSLLWAIALLVIQNYLSARKVGLPIRVIPISHTSPFWMLVDRRVLHVIKQIPFFGNSGFTRYNYRAWELADRYYSHAEMGDAFILVTPGRNWLYVADPEALMDIFRRRTDFPRCLELTEVINVFGPNISTVDGPQWKMQRKMTASCFNEPNNGIISKKSVDSVAQDTRTLSLHVLSRAGFGNPSISYKDSLQPILENCVLIMALGPKIRERAWWLLRYLRNLCSSFQAYMTTQYEEEKRAFSQGSGLADRNLMKSLVRASQEEAAAGSSGLTENEIYGNMFVLNFAGHDTTAHTFTQWHYNADFPRLKRCLSIMLETLRLYTPVPVAKWTDKEARQLNVGDKTVVIPPSTMVIPNSLTWHPSRWITASESTATEHGSEDLIIPRRGTFLGWSEGSRDCPGRKFSQVEFRFNPVTEPGETIDDAIQRTLHQIETDSAPVLLLQMLHPERAPLVWSRR
ncbi:cytochrome P450 [Xylaria arbuscula]|nr:cytochrome P450 [Xylaria arbuscula]